MVVGKACRRFGLASSVALTGFLAFAYPANAEEKAVAKVVVTGNGAELGETPLLAEVAAKVPPGSYRMRAESGGPTRFANVYQEGDKTYLATVVDRIPAKGNVTYSLERASKVDRSTEGVSIVESSPGDVVVSIDGKPFTTYLANQGARPYYFPLIGPSGTAVTRAYPMKTVEGEKRDHPHHQSLWFTHGNVNGVDFWSNAKGHGTVKEITRKFPTAGPALAQIQTTDDWVGPDGKVICKDERTVGFFDTHDSRVIDFSIVVRALDKPVTFGATKEGSFAIRVATSMDVTSKKGGKITNSEGLTDDATWSKPAKWVDYVGPVAGETVGITILNHPASFRYPTTWHVRTYGLFAANPFGGKDFGPNAPGNYVINPGQSIRFDYRVIVHKGDTASAKPGASFEAYANPPKVEVSLVP